MTGSAVSIINKNGTNNDGPATHVKMTSFQSACCKFGTALEEVIFAGKKNVFCDQLNFLKFRFEE